MFKIFIISSRFIFDNGFGDKKKARYRSRTDDHRITSAVL